MYPKQVIINEQNLAKFTKTLETAYTDIVSEISTATDFGIQNRKKILAQIENTLQEAGEVGAKFIEKEIPAYYKDGSTEAIKQLKNVDAPVPEISFTRFHKNAIIALVDDTARAFGESLTGVARSADLLLGKATRDLITQKIAKGQISGEALRETRLTIKGILQEQGLSALVDKSGRTWTLDRYSEMLIRTKAVEARNRGLINRMVQNEYDLVQVSAHGAIDVCQKWEGKILSMTGETKSYPTIREAEKDGLFHPNCKHAVNALVPSLSNRTRAYDPNTKTLSPAGAGLTNI